MAIRVYPHLTNQCLCLFHTYDALSMFFTIRTWSRKLRRMLPSSSRLRLSFINFAKFERFGSSNRQNSTFSSLASRPFHESAIARYYGTQRQKKNLELLSQENLLGWQKQFSCRWSSCYRDQAKCVDQNPAEKGSWKDRRETSHGRFYALHSSRRNDNDWNTTVVTTKTGARKGLKRGFFVCGRWPCDFKYSQPITNDSIAEMGLDGEVIFLNIYRVGDPTNRQTTTSTRTQRGQWVLIRDERKCSTKLEHIRSEVEEYQNVG